MAFVADGSVFAGRDQPQIMEQERAQKSKARSRKPAITSSTSPFWKKAARKRKSRPTPCSVTRAVTVGNQRGPASAAFSFPFPAVHE